jgi:hypothetical protein
MAATATVAVAFALASLLAAGAMAVSPPSVDSEHAALQHIVRSATLQRFSLHVHRRELTASVSAPVFAREGARMSVMFDKPLAFRDKVSGALVPLAQLSPEQELQIGESVEVRIGDSPLTFDTATENGMELFAFLPSHSREAEQWILLGMEDDGGEGADGGPEGFHESLENELQLVLLWPAGATDARLDASDVRVSFREGVLECGPGATVPNGSVALHRSALPALALEVVLADLSHRPEEEAAIARAAASRHEQKMQARRTAPVFQTVDTPFGGEPSHEAAASGVSEPRNSTRATYEWEDEDALLKKRMVQRVFAEFIQTIESSPPFDKATEAGWHLGRQWHATRESGEPLSLLAVEEHLASENAAGVSLGFILAAVVEGFLPKAVKQGTDKMINLMEKHLVPLTEDLLGGEVNWVGVKSFLEEEYVLRAFPAGERHVRAARERREMRLRGAEEELRRMSLLETASITPKKGHSGIGGLANDGPGVLAVAIADDLIKMVPSMVDQTSKIFSNLLSEDLHSSLTDSCLQPLQDDITRGTGQTLIDALSQTLGTVIPAAVKRLLLPYLRESVPMSTTNGLVRAVTHSLTHVLQHTLLRTPKLERDCYECHFFRKNCDHCAHGEDQKRQFSGAYYADYYAAMYSDYYANMATQDGAEGGGGDRRRGGRPQVNL